MLKDFINNDKQTQAYFYKLIIASIPAIIIGLFFSDLVESTFNSEAPSFNSLMFFFSINSVFLSIVFIQ